MEIFQVQAAEGKEVNYGLIWQPAISNCRKGLKLEMYRKSRDA